MHLHGFNPDISKSRFQGEFHNLLRSPDDQVPRFPPMQIFCLPQDFPGLEEIGFRHISVSHRWKISP